MKTEKIKVPVVYKGKFIEIVRLGEMNEKPYFGIINKKSQALGTLLYYKEWKKYVMMSEEDVVFDKSCLKQIIEFMSMADSLPPGFYVKDNLQATDTLQFRELDV